MQSYKYNKLNQSKYRPSPILEFILYALLVKGCEFSLKGSLTLVVCCKINKYSGEKRCGSNCKLLTLYFFYSVHTLKYKPMSYKKVCQSNLVCWMTFCMSHFQQEFLWKKMYWGSVDELFT